MIVIFVDVLFERVTKLTFFSTEPIANMEPSFATPNQHPKTMCIHTAVPKGDGY